MSLQDVVEQKHEREGATQYEAGTQTENGKEKENRKQRETKRITSDEKEKKNE